MAYAFDNINNLLGEGSDQQQGSNIFSSGQTAQTPDQTQSAAGESGSAAKTSTEGELSPGGSGSSTTGASTDSNKATPQSSGQAILEKSKNESYAPDFGNKIVGEIKKGGQTLQDQANQYVTAQSTKAPKGVEDADVEGALSGNQDARNKVENVVRGPGVNADQFQTNLDSNFQDVDQIGTQGGLQAYLQKRGDEHYNSGQAALDSLLFSRDKGFQQTLADAKTERQKLRSQQDDLNLNLQRQQQEKLNAAQGEAKAQAQALLRQKQAAQKAVLQQRADDLGGRYSEDLADLGKFGNARAQEEYQRFAASLSPQDKIRLDMMMGKVNPGSTYAKNKYAADVNKQFGYRNSGTADQASRYNNILSMLGEGGDTVNAGDYSGDAREFDYGGYRDAMRNALAQAPQGNAIGGTVKSGSNGFGDNAFSGLANMSHEIQSGDLSSLATSPYNAQLSSLPGGSKVSGGAKKLVGR